MIGCYCWLRGKGELSWVCLSAYYKKKKKETKQIRRRRKSRKRVFCMWKSVLICPARLPWDDLFLIPAPAARQLQTPNHYRSGTAVLCIFQWCGSHLIEMWQETDISVFPWLPPISIQILLSLYNYLFKWMNSAWLCSHPHMLGLKVKLRSGS